MFKYNSKDMLKIESSFPLRTVHFLAFCTMLYKIRPTKVKISEIVYIR